MTTTRCSRCWTTLGWRQTIRLVAIVVILCVIGASRADRTELGRPSTTFHPVPAGLSQSIAQLTGCHCNCTSNNNDDLTNIGFFPCQSYGCISCAPTRFDVCVAAYTDADGNKEFGMYVCLTGQGASPTCLFNLQIPYFSCESSGRQDIECQYDRGNEDSTCTFTAPGGPVLDGCYPISQSCTDPSRVCCEKQDECECLSDIFAPSSDICLQKSVSNNLWGSCSCDSSAPSGAPVCGACGDCPATSEKGVSDGGDQNNSGNKGASTQNPVKVAGVVVPVIAIIVLIIVGGIYVWRKRGLPDW